MVDFGETVKLVDNNILGSDQNQVPNLALFKVLQDPYQQVKITHLGNDQNKTLWRVIRHGEAYPLGIGETLKIGKLQLQLRRIVCNKSEIGIEEVTEKESTPEQ